MKLSWWRGREFRSGSFPGSKSWQTFANSFLTLSKVLLSWGNKRSSLGAVESVSRFDGLVTFFSCVLLLTCHSPPHSTKGHSGLEVQTAYVIHLYFIPEHTWCAPAQGGYRCLHLKLSNCWGFFFFSPVFNLQIRYVDIYFQLTNSADSLAYIGPFAYQKYLRVQFFKQNCPAWKQKCTVFLHYFSDSINQKSTEITWEIMLQIILHEKKKEKSKKNPQPTLLWCFSIFRLLKMCFRRLIVAFSQFMEVNPLCVHQSTWHNLWDSFAFFIAVAELLIVVYSYFI